MLTLINLLAHSFNEGSLYLLSVDSETMRLPSLNLDSLTDKDKTKEISVNEIVKGLYDKYIDLDYNWAQPKLLDIDIFYSEQKILQTHIYYSCYIPYATRLNSSSWIIGDSILPHSQILRKALLCSK